jgi:hypothetical protein
MAAEQLAGCTTIRKTVRNVEAGNVRMLRESTA